MNDALLDAFRHNIWATKELLAACRELSDEQLGASASGSYGDVLATFNHLVRSDAAYLRRLSGIATPWVDLDEQVGIAELLARANEAGAIWERYLAGPIDADRIFIVDEGTYRVMAGVLIAQALNHGNVHREQICANLTAAGIEPPDLQGWAYGEATGRGGPIDAGADA